MSNSTSNDSSNTLDTSTITSIVALVVSITALFATTLQVLQQYYASAAGYANCDDKVMGLWARYTHRKFRPYELRFEVQFEAPVIFLSRLDNRKFPVDGKAYFIDGSKDSYNNTGTEMTTVEENKLKKLRESVHTADNERATWLSLLSALHKMEEKSTDWEAKLVGHNREYIPTLAVAVQKKKRSWDSMPNIKKPYATTTISHLVEMAAVLGVYWQEFDRKTDNYRAEGNGYILIGSNMSELGIVFTFEIVGPSKFLENRVIPLYEVKELCFGFVPTIFRKQEESMEGPLDIDTMKQGEMHTLQFGSRHEIAETLVLIGCDTNTVNYFLHDDKKTAHLFPVPFEIMGMLGKTLHIRGSCFRVLPNPTIFYWNKKSFSVRELLNAFHKCIEKETDTETTSAMGTILRLLELIAKEMVGQVEGSPSPALLDALHTSISETNNFLTAEHIAPSRILDVLWRHIQAVLSKINTPSLAHPDSSFDQLNHTRPVEREIKFIDIYFKIIRKSVLDSTERNLSTPGGDRGAGSVSSGGEAVSVNGGGKINNSAVPTPGLKRSRTNQDERNDIWCMLVFRMLCWLMLHDFSKKDMQIPKSELLGSRLPVYIT